MKSFVFFLMITFSGCHYLFGQDTTFDIPSQKIIPWNLIGNFTDTTCIHIHGFQVSDFITLKEYKEYLDSVKRDSLEAFYLSQLPDSNLAAPDIYEKYISKTEYEKYPVLGISWENAMNYCKWKTLLENKDSIIFIYRLPTVTEWLSAESYLDRNNVRNDLDDKYSDWLLNSRDESFYNFTNTEKEYFPFDYTYFHKKNDPLVLKRKLVIGNSYLFHQNGVLYFPYSQIDPFSYYANEGYRQVSFRLVKDYIQNSKQENSTAASLLKYWGINKK